MAATITPKNPELFALIENQFHSHRENSIVRGNIIEIRPQVVVVDINAKSEGIIPISELRTKNLL